MENKPKYSIVRVDDSCLNTFNPCLFGKIFAKHKKCKDCRYGDTKEQLIRKVAQVLFKRKYKINERLYGYMSDNFKKRLYTQCLEASKEIVEFWGGIMQEIFDGYYEEECYCQEERYGEGNIWKGAEYQEYKINEMEERHIKNCIKMLR